jgi:hypothetical protein
VLSGPLTASGNLEASVDVAADLARLFPDLTSGGHLEARGKLALQRTPEAILSGALKVDAREFPAELLGPWIDAPGLRALELADTHLDADANVEVAIAMQRMPGTAAEDIVRGSAEVVWRRAELPLLTASVLAGETEPSGVRLEVDARLLPRAAGERVVRGVLTAPSWSAWTDAELRKTHVELDFPDLTTAAAQLALDADEIRHWPLVGFLHAELDARGPLTHPDLRFVGAWDHDGQRLIDASAESLSSEGAGLARPVGIEINLLPGEPGRRHLSGSFLPRPGPTGLQGELDDMHLVVELPDLKRAAEDMLRRYRTLFAELPLPEGLERFVDTSGELSPGLASGSLVTELAATGPLTGPNVELDAVWVPAAGERVRLEAEGILSAIAPVPSGQGRVRLDVERLDLGRVQPWLGAAPGQDGAHASSASDVDRNDDAPAATHELAGRVSGSVELEGEPQRWAGVFRVDGEALRFGEYPGVDRLRIEGRSDGDVVELSTLSADLERRYPAQGAGKLEGRGSFDAVWPPGRLDFRVELTDPLIGIERATADLRLEEATLYVDPLEVEAGGELALLRAVAPLDALRRLAGMKTDAPRRTGELSAVSVELMNWKVGPFLALLDEERGVPGLTATVDGSLAFYRLDVASIRGRVDVSDLAYEVEGETVAAGATLHFELGEGEIRLLPARLQATGSPIDGRVPLTLSGSLELARGWQPEQGVGALITGLALDLEGAVELSLLNPFLAGGAASGTAAVDARAKGRFDALTANARLSGPEASLLWISPYATKFESPEIDLHIEGSRAELKTARATLNGGSCALSGSFENGNLNLAMSFDQVRYRLNFGVVAILGGHLELHWPLQGRRRLSGEVVMQRGVLRRDIKFGRHLLDGLSGSTHKNPILDTVVLDLTLTTDEGLNINNNLATLRADWDHVDVRGTLAEPRLTGRIEVDPGGRITMLGQVYRIDEGVLTWSDEPASQPGMLFETTSSLEDPTLKQDWRQSGLEVRGPGTGGMLDFWDRTPRNDWEVITNGMMSYYQSALASGLSSGLDMTTISFEQLPIFGETDTQARFTVSADVSPNVTFIVSNDPRQAQAQTYIVDLHRFSMLPNMRAQVFTKDSNNGGLTLQHTLRFGAGTKKTDLGPRVRRVHVEPAEGVPKRRVRRAVEFRKGDPFPPGASLDVEVDVAEALSRRGYPAAGVDVAVEPVAGQKVELGVVVNPGPRIQFAFEGEKLPKSVRREIVTTYRPLEIGQRRSVDNVRTETTRALRSRGFIEPQVEVIVEPMDEDASQGGQKVRVLSLGGQRVEPGPPHFAGIPEADAQELVASFPSVLSRIELALGDPAADRVLQRALDELGYPRAQVASRELSDDGENLLVHIAPGPRRKLARIELAGVEATLVDPIAEANRLIVGEPVRSGQVADAVDEIEALLQAEGHAEAKARGVLEPLPDDEAVDVVLRFEVDAGPRFSVENVRFDGLRVTRRKWAERRAGIEEGEALSRNALSEARRRLSQSGVFRRIRVDTDSRAESPDSGRAGSPMKTTVTFDVDEAPRYWLSYGGRWESDLGLGVVVDVVDRNSLGRGHASGIRGIYGSRLKSLRLYHMRGDRSGRRRQRADLVPVHDPPRSSQQDPLLHRVRESKAQRRRRQRSP